ncbi:MAG TPA: NAD-dependent epimerase [Nevskiaceae bacterium]|nr:NAD-dependent epimerase [Nevskiaceae bacterium]
MARVLVTGAAGFVGFHLAQRLLADGHTVVGLDNLNDYYDPRLKHDRLAAIGAHPAFTFEKLDLADRDGMAALFAGGGFEQVVHLAAQAGVRYSLDHPLAYVQSNLVGFAHVLEGCRHHGVKHLLYASSSSVYGANERLPWRVADNVDHPVSLYAATKKSNELMAHTYAHLYGLPCTGLRFFTVYGPWGRPDMAYFKFTQAMLAGQPIDVYNEGRMQRDFTYIDDVVVALVRLLEKPAAPNPAWNGRQPDAASSRAPYRVYNIGNHQPAALTDFIAILERLLGVTAVKRLLPMQPGDVPATYADVAELARDADFAPSTPLETGLQRFVDWYRGYYGKPRA